MCGYKDDELTTRWLQFGVFSPIMRLHSSNGHFNGKEPWNYNVISEAVMKRYLRLRHELIPYLYTMNYYASKKGQPLVRPMYYLEPETAEAYKAANEYYFGTELIVCPITKPMDRKARAACVFVWLPEGLWFDFFERRVYRGGRNLTLYRDIENIPVLAKAGAIIPMADLERYTNSVENPEKLRVKIYPGNSNSFHLYEDEGDLSEDVPENWADTFLEWKWDSDAVFYIHEAKGNTEVIPERRSWRLEFYCIGRPRDIRVLVDGKEVAVYIEYDGEQKVCVIELQGISNSSVAEVHLERAAMIAENDVKGQIFDLLYQAEIEYSKKEEIYQYVLDGKSPGEMIGILQGMELSDAVYGMLCEVLLA